MTLLANGQSWSGPVSGTARRPTPQLGVNGVDTGAEQFNGVQTRYDGTGGPRIGGGQTNTAPFATGRSARTPQFGVGGTSTFGADRNLLSTQINPVDSNATRTAAGQAAGAASNVANFQFSPWQGVQPLDLSGQSAALTGANTQMQGLRYDFSGANNQYAQGQQTLGAAGAAATSKLGALGAGTSLAQYTGGGANYADTSGLDRSLAQATSAVGDPFAYQGDTNEARGLTLSAYKNALNAPDRGALSASNLDLFEQRSNPAYQQSLRDVTAKNAAMGRRGSGITTNELGDVTLARERELSLARQQAANDAASQTLADRTSLVNTGLGVSTGFGGMDVNASNQRLAQAKALADIGTAGFEGQKFNAGQGEAASQRAASGAANYNNFQRGVANDQYGIGADQANYARGIGDAVSGQERDRVGLGVNQAGFARDIANDQGNITRDTYSAGVTERNAGRADEYNRFGAENTRLGSLAGWQNQNFGQDRTRETGLRTERDYQTNRSDKAVSDEMDRAALEEQLRNGQYGRGLGIAGLGFGGQSPTSTYQGASDRAGSNAASQYGAVGDFLQQYTAGRRNTGGRRSGAGAGTSAQTLSGQYVGGF